MNKYIAYFIQTDEFGNKKHVRKFGLAFDSHCGGIYFKDVEPMKYNYEIIKIESYGKKK